MIGSEPDLIDSDRRRATVIRTVIIQLPLEVRVHCLKYEPPAAPGRRSLRAAPAGRGVTGHRAGTVRLPQCL
jgi:hypothetical protein